MSRLLFGIATALCCGAPLAGDARDATNAASHFVRSIGKEPAYETVPKYCLLVLGNSNRANV